jgi:hypothetical protein
MVRVVRPGGIALVDMGGWGTGERREIQHYFAQSGGLDATHPGANEIADVEAEFARHGAAVRLLPEVADDRSGSLGELIDLLEAGIFSFTWPMTPEQRTRGAEATRIWARQRFGDLNERRTDQWLVSWRAFDVTA